MGVMIMVVMIMVVMIMVVVMGMRVVVAGEMVVLAPAPSPQQTGEHGYADGQDERAAGQAEPAKDLLAGDRRAGGEQQAEREHSTGVGEGDGAGDRKRVTGSAATAGEGTQNILCAYLSVALLLGLGLNAMAGWWWADPIAALVIAVVALREGVSTWKGEVCCDAC